MNLIIDVGNTSVKLAVFNNNHLIEKFVSKTQYFLKTVKSIGNNYSQINKAIISAVGKIEPSDIDAIKQLIDKVLILDYTLRFPFTNKYQTPKTLGVDRVALVCASVNKYPNTNVLVIDAGTCITYDFINAKNEYLGGAISPGIRLRYQSLNHFTEKLPLLEANIPGNITGNTTEASIHSGVINGILNEIDGVILQYKQFHKDLTVILTGGDAIFLSNQLKSSIFANSNFLLEGLNYILDYNIK